MRIVVVKSNFNNLSPCCDVSQIRDKGRLQTAAGTACDVKFGNWRNAVS